MLKRMFALLLPLSLVFGPAWAGEQDDIAKVKATLALLSPDVKASSIAPAPVPGLYEVVVGANVLYITGDGRYMVQGDIFDVQQRKNLSSPKRNEARIEAINAIGENEMFIFAPKTVKHTISVFTDIDCAYCRKLHREIKQYTDAGIKVRYLMFPRAGVNSKSYEKAVDAWCADDRNAALTRAKNGEQLPKKDCPNPVKEHMALGEMVGVSGTPTIVTETGQVIPGYVPADRLAKLLDHEQLAHN